MATSTKAHQLADFAKTLALEMGSNYQPSPLVSYEQHQEKFIQKIETGLDDLVADFVQGLRAIYSVIDEAIAKSSSSPVQLPTLEQIADRLIQLGQEPIADEELTLQELLNISDSALSVMFVGAHLLQTASKYDQAAKAFQALTLLHPKIGDFWIGLGAALEMQDKKEEALDAFRAAAILEPSNAAGYQQAAILAYELDDYKGACEIIQGAKDWMIDSGLPANELEELEREITKLDAIFKDLNQK